MVFGDVLTWLFLGLLVSSRFEHINTHRTNIQSIHLHEDLLHFFSQFNRANLVVIIPMFGWFVSCVFFFCTLRILNEHSIVPIFVIGNWCFWGLCWCSTNTRSSKITKKKSYLTQSWLSVNVLLSSRQRFCSLLPHVFFLPGHLLMHSFFRVALCPSYPCNLHFVSLSIILRLNPLNSLIVVQFYAALSFV